jgi:hypothetical protein
MPEFAFYDIEGDDCHKALGFECFSPEEAQHYEKALAVDVPEGSQLIVRRRRAKSGRIELLVGVTKLGQPLRLRNEAQGGDQPNPAPKPPKSLEIPNSVREASEAALDVMAARHGIDTSAPGWKKANRSLRNAEVATRMAMNKKADTLLPAGSGA